MIKHCFNVLLICILPDGGTKGAPVESVPVGGGAADLGAVVQMPSAMTPSNKTMPERSDVHDLKQ